MDHPKDHMSALLESGLYGSAEMLGCFLVSSSSTNIEANSCQKAENLVLLGDALLGKSEFRRAQSVYREALQQSKLNSKQSLLTVRNLPSTSNSSNAMSINENEVKFKLAQCYSSLNDYRAALLEMEGIPTKARTWQMNHTLGKLYRICKHNRAAIACFKDCLRTCPYILEAVTALAELGVSFKDIQTFLPQAVSRGRVPFDHFDRWLYKYAEAQCCIACNNYKGGLEHFYSILQRFPCNIHILLEIAKVEAIIGRNDDAILNFEKVRSLDPYVMTYMDEYAILLKSKSDHSKLSKLVHDLLNIDPARAEVFVALSVLWEQKEERRALVYAEKSLKIDERHIAGHVMKGNLLLLLRRPDAAVASFRAAQELRSDLRSFQGLVRSYLALSKIKEALYVAREAMKAMPQSAKALKMVGDVHASNPNGREKARKFYESSLRLEPDFLGAALALAELHVAEGRIKDAVYLLEKYLKDWADDSLHVKLAQVFAGTSMLSEALSHYQAALRINHLNEAAKNGLKRLEKQMKGLDPDAPEEDEDNEVEDAEEGDQEEADLN